MTLQTTSHARLSSSFKDPAGYVFVENDLLYRQVLPAGRKDFDWFTQSGLAGDLLNSHLIAGFNCLGENSEGLLLQLDTLPFISYPYEWSFGQLRDAGLLTLQLMRLALNHGLILKDATAYNVAFTNGTPIFLDHTSFEIYQQDMPWRAYRQFVMHFLAPLLLMKHRDLRCLKLLQTHLDGIPLDLVAHLLPWYTKLSPSIQLHIHLHACMEQKVSFTAHTTPKHIALPKRKLLTLVENLYDCLDQLKPPAQKTTWADYHQHTSYTDDSFACKRHVVRQFCREHAARCLIDLGANKGDFSRLAAEYFPQVIAADVDASAVEHLYQLAKELPCDLQPVLLDLNCPSPDLGVLNDEHPAFLKRAHADAILGLALIHHLRITGNWSCPQIVALFASLAPHALVEFVPLDDPQTQQLTRGRDAIYQDWTLENMCRHFSTAYDTCRVIPIAASKRSLLELHRS